MQSIDIFGQKIVPNDFPQVKIRDVLDCFPKKGGIKFVEVGASDGIKNDYIYNMVKNNEWTGILIEPVPGSFRLLKKNFHNISGIQLINAAISNECGERDFYVGKSPSTSSLNAHHAPLKISDIIKVKVLTLQKILEEYNFGKFDLLQIDAEGSDFDVIRSLNLNEYSPSIIHYEHRHLDKKDECERYLEGLGYRLYFNRNNTIATR